MNIIYFESYTSYNILDLRGLWAPGLTYAVTLWGKPNQVQNMGVSTSLRARQCWWEDAG